MIPILDKNEESGIGGYVYGMNTVDDPRDLVQGECQLLENTLPGKRMTPRNGIVDLFNSTSAIGRGTEHTRYTPHSALMANPSGEYYAFVWTQQVITLDVFVIEAIKISDGTRTAIMTAKFSSVDTICSMKVLYSSVYCSFSHSVVENYTNQHLIGNVIIYWDTNSSAWAVRSWGINYIPKIDAISCVDTGGEIRLDARSGASAAIAGGYIYLTMGVATSRKLDSLTTYNLTTWDTKTVEPIEYLLDENGDPFIEEEVVPAEWVGREGHRLCYFQNRIWMMGGESDAGLMNDLWYTDDGSVWYRHITNCDWTARKDFAVVVFNNKMYLLGGSDVSGANDEVWSFDGTTWTEITTTGFAARRSHEAVYYDDKIWVALGDGKTDVINSSDGVAWSTVTADASLGARENYGLIVHDNKMWVVGGYNGSNYLKSVYNSTDGSAWSNVTSTAAWTERAGHITLSFAGKMYVLTGFDGTNYLNDIWSSEDGATWTLVLTGLTKNKYYSYAFTVVRRTDSLSYLNSMTDYNYEPWESYDGRVITGVNEKLLSGTVSLTGTALSGSGTAFLTEIESGDRIRIDGAYNYYTVTGITDNGTAAVENDAGDSYADANFALLPADGDSITTGDYNAGIDESPEQVSARQIVQCVSSTDYGRAMIPLPVLTEEVAQGATHLRIFRTIGGSTSVIAGGLTHLYLVDIAINDTYDSGNYYRDELSDDIQQTETNSIETNGYEVAPFGIFLTWDQERMWLSIGGGFWLYSVGASQDVEYPQKFASLFNASTQMIRCDPEDGGIDTGSILFEKDLYLFKNSKIYILDSADPVNIPRATSEKTGCEFPNTITHIDHPRMGKAVLFLSGNGPAILTAGGVVSLLSSLQLIELWPGEYFHIDPATNTERAASWKEKVFACWFENAYRVFCPDQTIPTIYSYFVDSKDEVSGSFVDTVAATSTNQYPNDPYSVIIKNENVAYLISSKSNIYRLSQFLKHGTFRDLIGVESCSYHQKTQNRFRGLNQDQTVMGEFSHVNILCDMKDDDGLSVTAYCDKNRFNATMTYSENVDTDLEAAGYDDIRTEILGVLEEGIYGRSYSVLVDKTVPSDGDFSFTGVNMNVQPQEEFESEFYGVFGARQKGWV